jgi:hypothetical protein
MDTPTNKSNLISMKFWAKTKELWYSLSDAGKKKWLDLSIILTQNAWAGATANTDLKCPLKYDDFRLPVNADVDGDGKLEVVSWVHSPAMLYATFPKACKNTWDAVAVKQILEQLCSQYALRDAGIW